VKIQNGFVLLFVMALALQGCVTAAKHDKLKAEMDSTSAELSKCNSALALSEQQNTERANKIHEQEVLVSTLQAKLGSTSSAKVKLEDNLAEMKTALEMLAKQRVDAEKRIQEFRDFVKKFKTLTDTGKLTVKILNGQMVVTLSSDVLFSSGSAGLSKTGKAAILDVTSLLASVPDRKYQVEGFTDNVPIKTSLFPSNWELASARALTVVRAMLEAGMPPERVSAASFGETHPVLPNDTDAGRAANRRIEIVVIPDLSSLPGYDQLKAMSGP